MYLDFTDAPVNKFRMYGGNNGNKISILFQGENYMLKFPPKPSRNKEMSYTNGCISEYIACHIFQSLGMETQETLLGNDGGKITVACKDFTSDGVVLRDFASLKNTIIESSRNGYGTELAENLEIIREQQLMSPKKLETFFGDMFIGDSLLGNFDRHNGNWGFLVNEEEGRIEIAPIYDCGSCLYPQLDEKQMEFVLSEQKEIDERIYVFPNSALKNDGKKINYAKFLLETENKECLDSLKKIGSRIDLNKINGIIDNTPYISKLHQDFLKVMIKERKEKIIDKAMERVIEKSENQLSGKENEDKMETMSNWKREIGREKAQDSSVKSNIEKVHSKINKERYKEVLTSFLD